MICLKEEKFALLIHHSSHIVLVKNKTVDFRLCVDYRELNWLTVTDNFPIPLIDDHLELLQDKCVFT